MNENAAAVMLCGHTHATLVSGLFFLTSHDNLNGDELFEFTFKKKGKPTINTQKFHLRKYAKLNLTKKTNSR